MAVSSKFYLLLNSGAANAFAFARMNILYLNPCGQMGGAENALLQMLAGLRTHQPTWNLHLLLGEPGPLIQKAQAIGVKTSVLPFPANVAALGDSTGTTRLTTLLKAIFETHRYVRTLTKAVRTLHPEIIHAIGFKMHLLSIWGRPSETPVIWHIHDYVSNRPMMRRLLRAHSWKCNTVIAVSKGVQVDVRRICSRKQNIVVLYNSIDLKNFSPTGPTVDLDAAAGLPPAPTPILRVGLLATFARWKGHRVFLKALSLLPPDLPVRGYIIGGPIYQTTGSQCTIEELREEAARLGLSDKVGFTGFLDDISSVMRSLDLIVHASTEPEPFGLVIVEGLACGKPVVASEDSGAAELFSNGGDVLTYARGDADALAHVILNVLSAPSQRLGSTGRQSIEDLLANSRLASGLDTIYKQLISRAA